MPLLAGQMYRPSDIAFNNITFNSVWVVEQRNHRISKWDYKQPTYNFTLDAGHVDVMTVNNGGTGYSVGDPVLVSAPTINIANPVNAIAEVEEEVGGVITKIDMTEKGNGYDNLNPPTATATGGTGSILTPIVTTPWGTNRDGTTGNPGFIGDGGVDDTALNNPTCIICDGTRLVVTDTGHHRIRTIDPTTGGFIASVGQGGRGASDFYRPAGISINDAQDVLVIADEFNHRAKRYTVGDTPTLIGILNDPSDSGKLSFQRPHGIIFGRTNNFFYVVDNQRGLISRYASDGSGDALGQFGNPSIIPSGGHGLLGGTPNTVFANRIKNTINTINLQTISVTTGSTPGTGDGKLYHPNSVGSWVDASREYVVIANTLNNRIEVFSNVGNALTLENNFGRP